MDKITYSYLTNEDIHKAVKLFYEVINGQGGEFIYRYKEDELVQELMMSVSLGAWSMERLVGLGFLILDEEENKNQRDLLKLDDDISIAEIGWYVDSEYRGKGIAKFITDELTQRARDIGIGVLTAKARKENEISNKILNDKCFLLAAECDIGDGFQRNVYYKNLGS